MIDFIVYDMTHLRYFSPLTSALERIGFKTQWLLTPSNSKYNSIRGDQVQNVMRIGSESGCSSFGMFTKESQGTCAVTVETGSPSDKIPSRYDVVLSMQHGFDYTTPERESGKNVLNIMWDQIYAEQHAKIKTGCSYAIPSCPVSFWMDRNEAIEKAGSSRIATVFYPENGFHDIAMSACSELISMGIKPVVKQRRKNQQVPDMPGCDIVYDEIWHPSESIFYPIASEICVGFGTSAYTDAVAAGLTFVDCTAPGYSSLYLKPTSSRFYQCVPGEEVSAVRKAIQNPSRFTGMSRIDQDDFISRVMERVNVQRS